MHDSGICLISRDYTNNQANVDLFSGFLSAIFSFAREVANDVLREIKMEHQHIFYESRGDILISIVTENGITRENLKPLFEEVFDQFFQKYNDLLFHNIISRDQFLTFKTDIDQILANGGIMEQVLLINVN